MLVIWMQLWWVRWWQQQLQIQKKFQLISDLVLFWFIFTKIFMLMECCPGTCLEIASFKYSFTLIWITMLHIHMVMAVVFWSKCFGTPWFFAWVLFTTMKFHVFLQGLLRLKCTSTAMWWTKEILGLLMDWHVSFEKRFIWESLLAYIANKTLLILIMEHHMRCETWQSAQHFTAPFYLTLVLRLSSVFLHKMGIIFPPPFESLFTRNAYWFPLLTL